MFSLYTPRILTTLAQIQSFKDANCESNGVPTLKCLEIVFNNVLILAAAVVVVILFAMFIVGSFKYLTSRGNPDKTGEARKTIMYAIVGLLLFMSSYLILNIIQFLFLGDPEDGAPSLLRFEIPQFEPGDLDPPTPTP